MSATPVVPRRERFHRSELAVPATSPRFFERAGGAGAVNDGGALVALAHGRQAREIRRRVALVQAHAAH